MPELAKNKAGVVIIFLWRHQFLLILRDDKPDILSPNTWCPVTGGREDPEDFWQAAVREAQEEIGIVPENMAMLGVSRKGNAFFCGQLTDKEKELIVLGEGQRYDFFHIENVLRLKEFGLLGGAMSIYLEQYPSVFQKMADTEQPPYGRELGLATWNGELQ